MPGCRQFALRANTKTDNSSKLEIRRSKTRQTLKK